MIEECERAVKKAVEAGAEQAEAFVLSRTLSHFFMEKNSIKYSSGASTRGIGLRVLVGNRLGFAYGSEGSEPGELAKQAVENSKLGKVLKGFSFAFPEKPATVEKLFDKRIVDLGAEEGLEFMDQIVEGAKGVHKEINLAEVEVKYGIERFAIVNSNGLQVEDQGTFLVAESWGILKDKGVSNGFEFWYSRNLDADFRWIGESCAKLAVKTQSPKSDEGGVMTVLFHPYAFRDMLEFITIPALYGDSANRGESVYTNKAGEQVASEGLTMADDPTQAGGWNSASVDDEGVPSKRTEFIQNGILKGFMYDLASAAEFEEISTSNAMRNSRPIRTREFKIPPRAMARNFTLEGETKEVDELIWEVDKGVLVHTVLGAHTANPASGDFSVSCPRIFKIEKGEVVYPLKGAMVSGNLPSLFKSLSGLGNDYRTVWGHLGGLSTYIPTVRFEKVLVTGQ